MVEVAVDAAAASRVAEAAAAAAVAGPPTAALAEEAADGVDEWGESDFFWVGGEGVRYRVIG